MLDSIRTKRPKVFILENVAGLVHRERGKHHKDIMRELHSLGVYNIRDKILDTKENGIPHSRCRWYCVGILKSIDDGSFEFPSSIPCANIELLLEKPDMQLVSSGRPPASQKMALANVQTALRTLEHDGFDPPKDAFVVDCDSSPDRSKFIQGVAPCLTCRAEGHWITNRGRRFKKEEMM